MGTSFFIYRFFFSLGEGWKTTRSRRQRNRVKERTIATRPVPLLDLWNCLGGRAKGWGVTSVIATGIINLESDTCSSDVEHRIPEAGVDNSLRDAVAVVARDGRAVVAAALEQVGHVDALARAQDVRVVRRRADAHRLRRPPEHVAHLVRQPLQRVRRLPPHRTSEDFVQQYRVVRRPCRACARKKTFVSLHVQCFMGG